DVDLDNDITHETIDEQINEVLRYRWRCGSCGKNMECDVYIIKQAFTNFSIVFDDFLNKM
ncbi:1498_t:CDS:2, partial [Dentiscutata heterogama]